MREKDTPSSSGRVLRFPARSCVHYVSEHCLREERANPGLSPAFGCRVLASWCAVYDGFLERAERFVLTEGEVGKLWRRQSEKLAEPALVCERFLPGDVPGDVPGDGPGEGDEDEQAEREQPAAEPQAGVARRSPRESASLDVGCLHGLGDLCLLALPPCQGHCDHFTPRPGRLRHGNAT